MEYNEQEKLKSEAWGVYFAKTSTINQKAWAILEVVRAHYWRAKEGLEASRKKRQAKIHGKRYCKGYQLDIDVYTRHWLFANGERLVSKDVLLFIKEYYGYDQEESKYLPHGFSCYYLPNEIR